MWQQLLNTEYYITFQNEKFFDVWITDFISIWNKIIKAQDFLIIMKESNSLLEINDTELQMKGLEMLQKPELLKVVIAETDSSGNLILNAMKSYGYPVRLKMILCKGKDELFFQKVTYPLLQTVKDLKKSEGELCQLLLRKDQEIKEYKDEGGRIALRHLKTPKFDETKHFTLHKSYSTNFGFEEIPDSLLDKVNSVTVIKQEHEDIKPILVDHKKEIKEEKVDDVQVKQEWNSQPSQSSLISPQKRPKKLKRL